MKLSPFAPFCGALALAALALAGCQKNDDAPAGQTGVFSVELEHTVGAAPLVLATQTYTTPAGDQFTVSKFQYYLSNIKLTRTDGTQYAVPDSYFLVDAATEASQHLSFSNVPVGDYSGIAFTVGVDSARAAGAQTGALAVANGMYWDQRTGYAFLKLAGTSPQSPTGQLAYTVGGYQRPANALRTVAPAFPSGIKLLVRPDHTPEVHFAVDALKLFTGPTTVRFSTLPSSTAPGSTAVLLANNYAQGMFSVEHIHAN